MRFKTISQAALGYIILDTLHTRPQFVGKTQKFGSIKLLQLEKGIKEEEEEEEDLDDLGYRCN